MRVESNLTNIFFTAEDKHKRFISTLKQEDIRVLEDGQPQQVFTFQSNTDVPLSLAILIDTSMSEERTLPEESVPRRASFSRQSCARTKTKRQLSLLRAK